ncbi:Active breakpoint cluster region-related protein, partial [Fragariocoptes setiger]
LHAWSCSLPQERADDPENYRSLLHKFRQFLSEVKEFQELHSNCSVTRDAIASNCPVRKFQNSLSVNNNELVESYFSGKSSTNLDTTTNDFTRDDAPLSQNRHEVLHQSKSHLPAITRLEPKHRFPTKPILGTNFMSSERLDMFNNNLRYNDRHNISPCAEEEFHSIIKTPPSGFKNTPNSRVSKQYTDDNDIYDAVAVEDIVYSNQQIQARNAQVNGRTDDRVRPSLCDLDDAGSNSVLLTRDQTLDHKIDRCELNNDCRQSSTASVSNLASASVSSLSIAKENSPDDLQFANYVNIDYFLKRTNTSSGDECDSEDENQQSNSLSSDQLFDQSDEKLAHSKSDDSIRDTNTLSSIGELLEPSAPMPTNLSRKTDRNFHASHSLDYDKNERFNTVMMERHENVNVSERSRDVRLPQPKLRKENALMDDDSPKSSDKYASDSSPEKDNQQVKEDPDSELKQSLVGVQRMMSSFLSDLNLSDSLFQAQEKIQRRIVKESFAVEFCSKRNARKLRHLFLFNDIIVCAKYQSSAKQKFTFDVKWYLSLSEISIPESDQGPLPLQHSYTRDEDIISLKKKPSKNSMNNQILTIKTNLSQLRTQIERLSREKKIKPSSRTYKRLKKKRTELEAELVLLLPHLPLTIFHNNEKRYTFYLSSSFERNQWVESIRVLQHQLANRRSHEGPTTSPNELQAWIQTCRKSLNPNLGSFLLRSNSDEDLLYGDLNLTLCRLQGMTTPGDVYFCFEVDNYGHFFQKASSTVVRVEAPDCSLDESFIIPLDGTHSLRILFYEYQGSKTRTRILGKSILELSRSWLSETPINKVVCFGISCRLSLKFSYNCSELNLSSFPHARIYPHFGTDIQIVCKKEKSAVPLIIQLCLREIERRGLREPGIYRISGLSSDILRLRKAFETNTHAAELLLREVDIHAVTGLLKMYLRELPDALFTNALYIKFVSAFNMPHTDNEDRTQRMMALFSRVPPVNQMTITMIIEHLVRVNKYEAHNKMSLTNLATVFGLNMIRSEASGSPSSSHSTNAAMGSGDPFTAGTITVMAQAGILYLFLCRVAANQSLVPTELSYHDSSPKAQL